MRKVAFPRVSSVMWPSPPTLNGERPMDASPFLRHLDIGFDDSPCVVSERADRCGCATHISQPPYHPALYYGAGAYRPSGAPYVPAQLRALSPQSTASYQHTPRMQWRGTSDHGTWTACPARVSRLRAATGAVSSRPRATRP